MNKIDSDKKIETHLRQMPQNSHIHMIFELIFTIKFWTSSLLIIILLPSSIYFQNF